MHEDNTRSTASYSEQLARILNGNHLLYAQPGAVMQVREHQELPFDVALTGLFPIRHEVYSIDLRINGANIGRGVLVPDLQTIQRAPAPSGSGSRPLMSLMFASQTHEIREQGL